MVLEQIEKKPEISRKELAHILKSIKIKGHFMRKIKGLNAIYPGKKLTIAIDIDGTVADCSKVDLRRVNRYPDEFMKAMPLKGAQEAVRRLYKEGHSLSFLG